MKYLLPLFLSSCAILHSVQVGEVNSRAVLKGRRFVVLESGTGVNLEEARDMAKMFTRSQQAQKNIDSMQKAMAMIQMGPKTGNPVFSLAYTEKVFSAIRKKCSQGVVSGLTSIRETAKYPVVSGEIIKIIGYCEEK